MVKASFMCRFVRTCKNFAEYRCDYLAFAEADEVPIYEKKNPIPIIVMIPI
jgi:hypothetical protein